MPRPTALQGQLEQRKKLFLGEPSALDLRAEKKGRDFAVQGDNDDGVAGFFQGGVAAFGFAGNESGPLECADSPASGDSSQTRHTRTSTWLVMTSGIVAR